MNLKNKTGVTLIELMIVVAIIGILAAIGSVSYSRYMKSGKIERLKTIALEVANGQNNYRARNNQFFPVANGTVDYAGNIPAFQNLLDYTATPPVGIIIETTAWDGTGVTCGASCWGVPHDASRMGYAVTVRQDLDGDTANEPTTIVIVSDNGQPSLMFEGQ